MASLWQPAPYNSTTTSRRPSGLVCQQSRHGAPQALAPGPRQHRAPLRREVLPAATAGGRGGEGKQPQQQQQMGSPPPGVAALQAEPVAQPAAGRVLRVGSRAAPPTAEAAMLAAADPVMGEAVEPAPSTAPPAEMPPPAQQQQQQEQPGGPTLGLDSKVVGMICLLGVAMLKGSYNSMLRLLYAQDGPPGPVAIMLFRGVLQSIVLVAAYLLVAQVTKVKDSEAAAGGDTIAAAEGAAVGMPPPAELPGTASDGSSLVPAWAQRISSRLPYTAIAASELGLWLFLATAIQTLGLQLTTATRAGFLIQSTALLTPVLASFTGEKPSRNVWAGCLVALVGCLFIASDASATDATDTPLFSLGGDAAVLSAAFFFSLAMVRLGTYARRIPSVELAAAKSVVLGGVAFVTFLFAAASMTASGIPITDLWPGYDNPLSWAVMIYCALGPGALAAFLHAKGQSVVPPAEAQIIFSSMPLWSVAFAFLLLGGEPMSEKTVVGGAAVVAAGFIASRKDGGAQEKPDAAVATAPVEHRQDKGDKQA